MSAMTCGQFDLHPKSRNQNPMASSPLARPQPFPKFAISTLPKIPIPIQSRSRSLHEGPDTVDELLDRHLVKKKQTTGDDEADELLARQRLTSTRRESLSLYRDIIRASRFFSWPDSRGVPWRDVLRENARREFEEARSEKDPEVVTRLLIGGRDAVQAAIDKLVETHRKKMAEDEEGSRGGR